MKKEEGVRTGKSERKIEVNQGKENEVDCFIEFRLKFRNKKAFPN